MSKIFKLNIVTPNNDTIQEEIVSLITTTAEGKIEFLANHIEAVVSLVPTVTILKKESGQEKRLFTSMGVACFKDNTLRIICDSANWPEEIDQTRAESAMQRADERLKSDDDVDKARAEMALARAISRLQLKKNNH